MKILVSFIAFFIFSILLGIISINCTPCTEYVWGYSHGEFDQYHPNLTQTTNAGILYDSEGQNISPQLIDRLTDEVENCLHETFPDSTLSDKITEQSFCQVNIFEYPINRKSFNVMIPNDWVLNCDQSQQVLPTPVQVGPSGCVEKGLTPTDQCPCRWRAGIKCPNTLIVTPSFYLYKDALVRLITRCQNPWLSPELTKCVTPSTTSLSDGSDPKNGL